MKKKWILCIVTSIIIGSAITCFLLKPWKYFHPKYNLCIKKSYFIAVPLTETSTHIPCIEVQVENKKITATVDLGSSSMIALPKNFLGNLNRKSFLKQTSYWGILGKIYHNNLYKIPKIEIDAMSIHPVMAEEVNPEFVKDSSFGKKLESPDLDIAMIGWRLFSIFNVLLDCENNKIAFCDSLDTLRKQGYPVDSFVEIPISLDRNLIEFEVMTHKGKMRCVLDTGCTLNILNKDLENGSNEHMIFNLDNIDQHKILNPNNSNLTVLDLDNTYEIPVFKIGKKDFGKTTFTKIKMPLEIDAFVGMEFLRSKLVFIDFPNKKIYFYEK